MNLFKHAIVASGLLGCAGAVQAGVSSTWTLTNDYDFRGNTQTAKDPALQASVDYAHDSGWYVGAWGSNLDEDSYPDADLELDLYTGFSKSLESGLTLDGGLYYYSYPGESDYDYLEVYASVAKDWFKAKLWYSPAFGGDFAEDFAQSTVGTDDVSAWYLEANGTWPLPNDFSLLAHVGFSTGDYWDNVFGDDQIDYSLGVGYTVGHFNLGVKWVDTDSDTVIEGDVFNNEGRVIATVATTFPWSSGT